MSTFGKVRDWLVAGATGLTIAKFAAVKSLLLTFAGGPGPGPYAMAAAVAVIFTALGFFSMFFQRELILNLLLAASRERRGRIEGTKQAGAVALTLLSTLPLYVTGGFAFADEWQLESKSGEKEKIRDLLKSSDVKNFLQLADDAASRAAPLDWDVVSKAAVLHYYLAYAVDESDQKDQIQSAFDWLQRAHYMFPQHVDMTAKYADILYERGQYADAIVTLRAVAGGPQSPPYVKQWLSVFLLAMPGNESESIELSKQYIATCPTDVEAWFNLAKAYALLYNHLLNLKTSVGGEEQHTTKLEGHKTDVLSALNKGLCGQQPENLPAAKEWVRTRDYYVNLLEDPKFKALIS